MEVSGSGNGLIPRLAGEGNRTVVCIGSGPSLTASDVEYCQGKAIVIAVNDAYRLAPWADVLYAADLKWWRWHNGVPGFRGYKASIYRKQPRYKKTKPEAHYPDVVTYQNAGYEGLCPDPTGLRTGHNSGYQAINLAVHLGALRVLLLGYDMHGDHWFGRHRDRSKPPFQRCLAAFDTIAEPLKAAGVTVINCSRKTAIRCFTRAPIDVALPVEEFAHVSSGPEGLRSPARTDVADLR